MTELRVVLAESVVVGRDDCLLIRVPMVDEDLLDDLVNHLERMGLGSRSLVVCGDVEFKVVPKDAV